MNLVYNKCYIVPKRVHLLVEQEVKIFLSEDALVELEDAYIEKKKDLRAQISEQVKILYKGAKMTKVHHMIIVNLKSENVDNGERVLKAEQVPLKNVELKKYNLPHNPDWIPENMEKDDTKTYVLKVGDNTWKYLLYFVKIYCVKIDLYNDKLLSNEKSEIAKQPACFEQVLHEQLISGLNAIISKNMDKIFDAEFEEVHKEEKKDDKHPIAGERQTPSETKAE